MCAPQELNMEQPLISRFNSSSTSRTLVGSDNGFVSPLSSPFSSVGGDSRPVSIVQTPDSKQWVDLDSLSDKLAKELRRQYDPSMKDDPSGPIAKGAAKVRAWARRSKLGIEIRLRRKLDGEHDEVTDIHLVPNAMTAEPVPLFEKSMPAIPELPGSQHEITSELPDSSVAQELDATQLPSRTSTDSSIGEPLPRYEPRMEPEHPTESANNGPANMSRTPDLIQSTGHRPSLSQSSIVETPTRGLSLSDLAGLNTGDSDPELQKADAPQAVVESHADDGTNAQRLRNDLDQTKRQLDQERQMSVQLQDIIKALQPQIGEDQEAAETSNPSDHAHSASTGHLSKYRVANKTTYETETDAEPSSPSQRRPQKAIRKKVAPTPKRKKSAAKNSVASPTLMRSPVDPDEDFNVEGGLLLRKPTGPTRLPSGVDAEAVWTSLLRLQAKILGPEHPLAYQAKSDLARSRANGHKLSTEDLFALRGSKSLATETLGIVHPWVSAFAEDLATLENMVVVKTRPEPTDSQKARSDEGPGIPSKSPEEQRGPANGIDLPNARRHAPHVVTPEQGMNASVRAPQTPQLKIDPNFLFPLQRNSPLSPEQHPETGSLWDSSRPPHKQRDGSLVLPGLIFDALMEAALGGIFWLQQNYGPEQVVQPGKVRVRWTCSCGEQLYDDFVERRPGAARELEAYLNRPRMATGGGGTPTSPSSSQGSNNFSNSSLSRPPSSQTSWSSYGSSGDGSTGSKGDTKPPGVSTGSSLYTSYNPYPEPPWLLTCANEDRFTPKLAHLDMAPHKIRTDKDLALSLRDHYFHLNKKWWRSLRLRGLTTIQFVQFEVHQNRFADVRKCPDMPAAPGGEYEFEPGDLLPPVGSQYLLHLFRHPEDYDGERITYLRAPKKHGRLQIGRGWGINLVEGVLLDRIWLTVSAFFAFGSLVFVIAWATKKHDVQGASGVAAWMVSLAVLLVGWLQTFLG